MTPISTTKEGKGLPPIHTQLLVGGAMCYFVTNFSAQWDSMDASVEDFTRVLFPEYMSVSGLCFIRFSFSAIILADCIDTALNGE